jgi:hypothetical protein
MTVTVYFKHGGSATVPAATKVEAATFPTITSGGEGHRTIALIDDQGQVIGHFMVNDISGYFIVRPAGWTDEVEADGDDELEAGGDQADPEH